MLPGAKQCTPNPLCCPHNLLSLLINQLQLMNATHETNLAKLEAHLVQTDLQSDRAIRMATAAKSQGVCEKL